MAREHDAAEKEGFLTRTTSATPTTTKEQVSWRSLPNKGQLFLLAVSRLAEPLSNTCLIPYIYYLLRTVLTTQDAAASPVHISTFSGLMVAAFSFAQCLTSVPWAYFADRYGRKPTIIISLLVSTIANAAFGFSRTLPTLMFWRIVAGLANGNVGVMRTMTAEIVKERKYQARAFLLLPLVFNSGMVAGLALGGCLAEPNVNLPWLFGAGGLFNFYRLSEGVEWTQHFPYALPAMFNAVVLAITLAIAYLGLKETLAGKEDKPDWGLIIGAPLNRFFKRYILRRSPEYERIKFDDFIGAPEPSSSTSASPRPMSLNSPGRGGPPRGGPPPGRTPYTGTIWTKEVIHSMAAYALLPLHNSAFIHLFPVYMSLPPADNHAATLIAFNGGLGLHSPSIGLYCAVVGVGGILLQLFIYPRLQARLGTLGTFRIALFVFPAAYLLAPYLSLAPTDGGGIARWIGIALLLVAQVMARTIAIPSTVILLTEAAPAKSVLGKIHGIGNMIGCFARAVGPLIGGWVFAWGLQHGVVGAGWWLYLTLAACLALGQSYLMVKDEPEE